MRAEDPFYSPDYFTTHWVEDTVNILDSWFHEAGMYAIKSARIRGRLVTTREWRGVRIIVTQYYFVVLWRENNKRRGIYDGTIKRAMRGPIVRLHSDWACGSLQWSEKWLHEESWNCCLQALFTWGDLPKRIRGSRLFQSKMTLQAHYKKQLQFFLSNCNFFFLRFHTALLFKGWAVGRREINRVPFGTLRVRHSKNS